MAAAQAVTRIISAITATGPAPVLGLAQETINERAHQNAKWGEQNHPNGTGSASDKKRAEAAKALTDSSMKHGSVTWKEILDEEVRETFAEEDPERIREELIQVAATALAWAEAIDRKAAA